MLYTVRYIASVILLFLLSIVMWWAVLTFGGDEAATALAEPFIGEESAEAMLEDEAITP